MTTLASVYAAGMFEIKQHRIRRRVHGNSTDGKLQNCAENVRCLYKGAVLSLAIPALFSVDAPLLYAAVAYAPTDPVMHPGQTRKIRDLFAIEIEKKTSDERISAFSVRISQFVCTSQRRRHLTNSLT